MRFLIAGLKQREAERQERTRKLNERALHLACYGRIPFSEISTRLTWWFAPGRLIAR